MFFSKGELYAAFCWFVLTAFVGRMAGNGTVDSIVMAIVPAIGSIVGVITDEVCYRIACKLHSDKKQGEKIKANKAYATYVFLTVPLIVIFVTMVLMDGLYHLKYFAMTILAILSFEIALSWRAKLGRD